MLYTSKYVRQNSISLSLPYLPLPVWGGASPLLSSLPPPFMSLPNPPPNTPKKADHGCVVASGINQMNDYNT